MTARRFWSGKRVFLTGHTGFKGSWLSLWLRTLGARVTGYSLPPSTAPNLFKLARVDRGIRSLTGDIRDEAGLRAAVRRARPEIVIHMAAQAFVSHGYARPRETFETNVLGTVNMAEACRATPSVKAFLNVTSDKCYDNRGWVWGYRESDPLGGSDPYSASKGCSEIVTNAYRESFFASGGRRRVACASARAGNVIGGGDWSPDRIVADCFRAWLKGKDVVVRVPNAVRPWQHVLNPLSGYLLLAERLYQDADYAGAWNFGPAVSDGWAVRRLVTSMAAAWNGRSGFKTAKKPAAFKEKISLHLDSSKAQVELGWRPRWDLNEAIVRIADWYQGYRDGADIEKICLAQIESFDRG